MPYTLNHSNPGKDARKSGPGSNDRELYTHLYTEIIASRDVNMVTAGTYQSQEAVGVGSVKIPVYGSATMGILEKGQFMESTNLNRTEAEIFLDKIKYCDISIFKTDELQNGAHQTYLTQIARQQGLAWARSEDVYTACLAIKAASQAAYLPGETTAGTVITAGVGEDFSTDMPALVAALSAASATMTKKGISKMGRRLHLDPVVLNTLVVSGLLTNKLTSGSDNGGIANGEVYRALGFAFIEDANIPAFDLTDDAAIVASGILKGSSPLVLPAHCRGDFKDVVGFGGDDRAVMELKTMDPTYETEWEREEQATHFSVVSFGGKGIYDGSGALVLKNRA